MPPYCLVESDGERLARLSAPHAPKQMSGWLGRGCCAVELLHPANTPTAKPQLCGWKPPPGGTHTHLESGCFKEKADLMIQFGKGTEQRFVPNVRDPLFPSWISNVPQRRPFQIKPGWLSRVTAQGNPVVFAEPWGGEAPGDIVVVGTQGSAWEGRKDSNQR